MINRLKKKFVALATVFMFVLMAVLLLIMNTVNYYRVVSESNSVLDVISQPGVPFPDGNRPPEPKDTKDMKDFMPPGMSPEVPYESRFFAVTVSDDGETVQSDLSRIVSVDDSSAQEYIDKALKSKKERGFIGDFRFSKMNDENGTRILFLDCGRMLDSFRNFLWISVAVGLLGCIIVFIAFMLTAGRLVSPIAESYEKQKRFISDAGHEIKTPLTIINANVDLLELDGEKEELSDIRQQTERLTDLTNKLVFLSKMEEAEHTLQKIDMPLSDIVTEAANSFRAPALSRSLNYEIKVEPGITVNGSPDAVRQLLSVLLENAVKYTPDGGEIKLRLSSHRKTAVLTVVNTIKDNINDKDLQHIFDRFYRTDASRNSQTGGHGIGLSIAKAIVDAHGGNITASTKTGGEFIITATLPKL